MMDDERSLISRLDSHLMAALEAADGSGRTVGERILAKLIERALAGDVEAIRLIWSRVDATERKESWEL